MPGHRKPAPESVISALRAGFRALDGEIAGQAG